MPPDACLGGKENTGRESLENHVENSGIGWSFTVACIGRSLLLNKLKFLLMDIYWKWLLDYELSLALHAQVVFFMVELKHRILMVSDFFYPNFGGVENHIYYLSQCLLKLGHKIGGLFLGWSLGVVIVRLAKEGIGCLTILLREKISLVHGHQAFSTLCHETLMNSRTMGYKVVFTDHSLYGFADVGNIHMNKVLQFTLADVTRAICVSHTSKENTVLRSGLPPEKVFVIPNAVDTAMFKPAQVRLSHDEIVIVVISGLVYRKGADLLLEVIPEVSRLYPNVSCLHHVYC
ncbi:Detected protein of confused Function [Hibiscus syriacus]|uniref:Detected protein of confused Function n=1 Tax=Hibiscus syriacus TaxID=106335 RepID=A0A6A3C135_HIBSY|nr:Detected protein of confused Function [Hibiscus syriacus]